MNKDLAEFYLRSIDYKPNHELKWDEIDEDVLEVWWEFDRPDCLDPTEWGVGRSGPELLYLPHIYEKEQLVRKIFAMTLRLEEHEAREFFRFGIERPFDPHRRLIDAHGRYEA
jgi:hypothetical protein